MNKCMNWWWDGWMGGWMEATFLSFLSLFFPHSLRILCTDLDKRPCNIMLVGVCAYCISSCSPWPLSSPHQGSGKASQLMTFQAVSLSESRWPCLQNGTGISWPSRWNNKPWLSPEIPFSTKVFGVWPWTQTHFISRAGWLWCPVSM